MYEILKKSDPLDASPTETPLERDLAWLTMKQHPLGAPFLMREFNCAITGFPGPHKAMAWELGGVIIVKLGCRVMTLEDWRAHGRRIYLRLLSAPEQYDSQFLVGIIDWFMAVESAAAHEIARFHRNLEHDTQAREAA